MKVSPARSLEHIIYRILVPNQLILGILIICLMIGSSFLNWQKQMAQEQLANHMLAMRIGEYFDSASRVMRTLALLPSSQAELDAFKQAYQFFDVLYRIDAQGHLDGISPGNRWLLTGMDMSAQPYFIQGLNDLAVSDMFISPQTGNPTVYLSMPVPDDGLVVGELSLSSLEQSIPSSRPNADELTFISESDGNILAHPDANLVRMQTNIRQMSIDEQILSAAPHPIYTAGNTWVWGNVDAIPHTSWLVVTQVPLVNVLTSFLLPTGISLLLILALFQVIIWRERRVLAQHVTEPLGQISHQAEQLAAGNYTTENALTAYTSAYAEISSLTNSFQRMSQAIIGREKQLSESEERLRFAMEATSDGLWDWDIRSGRVNYSPNYLKILGYQPGEFKMLAQSWEESIHPADRERVLQINLDCVENRVQNFEVEYRMRSKTGEWIWVLARGKAVSREESGQAIRLIGTHVDITERKLAEDAIRRMADELEQRVIERTASLEAANKELEAFSYSVSHDLRAPLRGIDGWSQALMEDYGSQLDEQAKNYMDRVRSEAQRMGRLIDDLLNLSRVSLVEIEKCPIDLSQLARLISSQLQGIQPDRKIEWHIQPDMQIQGDAGLLEITLNNLFDNAVKFSEKSPAACIEFGQINLHNQKTFYVKDNGVGFDMVYEKKLFGPFQRLHKPSEYPGTGIGLAIVKRAIRRHGGQIWAESKVGQGATFFFTLEKATG